MNSRLRLRHLGPRWISGPTLGLALSFLLSLSCSALEIQRVKTCSGMALRLRGDVREGDFARLKSYFKGREAIIGFDLSSEGGVLEEGHRIAEFIRRKKLTVYVADKCNSVCVDVFFAGAKRYFGAESKIGVHAISNHRDIEDTGSKLLTIKLARLWAKKGIPDAAIGKMVTTRPDAITYLDRADLSGLDASMGNPFAPEKASDSGPARQQGCPSQLHAGG